MNPPEESHATTTTRLYEALAAFRASQQAAAKVKLAKRAAKKAAAKKAADAQAAVPIAAPPDADDASAATPATPATGTAAPAPAAPAVAEPNGRPLFAGWPYDPISTMLSLVVIEDENATRGMYTVNYTEEPDVVVVGVREITPSVPELQDPADPRQTLHRKLRVVELPKVTLDEPLGDRPLLDAATGRPVELWRD